MTLIRLSVELGADPDYKLAAVIANKLRHLDNQPDYIHTTLAQNFIAWEWVLWGMSMLQGEDPATAQAMWGQDRLLHKLLLAMPYTHTAAKLKIKYYTLTRVLCALKKNETADISLGLGLKLLELLGIDTVTDVVTELERAFKLDFRKYMYVDYINKIVIFRDDADVPQVG